MTRYLPCLLSLLLSSCVNAQPAPEPPKEEPKKDAAEELPPPETKADLVAFIRKQYPDTDPAGEHDYHKIKNYSDPVKRFAYTRAMVRLLSFYISEYGFGGTLAKQFDAWANTELVNQPTFNALHAVVCMQYPDGRPNLLAAYELINKAVKQDPKFEYAHYVRARLLYGGFLQEQNSRREVEEALKAALDQREFPEALQLKARLLLTVQPPDRAAAKTILEKCFEFTPDDPVVFQDMLGLYAEAAGVPALTDKIELAVSAKKLNTRFEGQARAFLGLACKKEGDFNLSIKWYDKALAMVKPEDDPISVIGWHIVVAGDWAALAVDLRGKDPELKGQNKKLFESYRQTARDHAALAAELERVHMPVDLRGPAAFAFLQFMAKELLEYEDTIQWLRVYLEKTALRASVRSALEQLLNDFLGFTQGDEAAILKNFKFARDKDDVHALAMGLAQYADKVRTSNFHFKTIDALRMFIELMSHQNTIVAQLDAFLLVDTALHRSNPEDIEAAADAIAKRFEQETEMTTEARAKFQGQLLGALLMFDKRIIDLRAVKHLRKIVSATQVLAKGESELISESRDVIGLLNDNDGVWKQKVWGDDAANHPLRSSRQRRFEDLLKWLDEAIVQLEKLTQDKDEKK